MTLPSPPPPFPHRTAAVVPAAALAPAERAALDAALARWPAAPGSLLQVLREAQAATGWLSPPLRAAVADALGVTPATVVAVAGFYRFLHLAPAPRVRVLFSDNVTDRHLGSRRLAGALAARLGVEPGGPMRADGAVAVGFASCTGLGDQGPAALVDQARVLTRLDDTRVAEVAEAIESGLPPAAWPASWQRVDDGVRRADVLLHGGPARGDALRAMLARDAQAGPGAAGLPTLDEVARSRLRGRGGAGFATAAKWTIAREAPLPPLPAGLDPLDDAAPSRVIVCNADEGEPGTFKDRVLLAREADAVVEGMTVAARQVGARRGFVYLRGEYAFLAPHLQAVLDRRRREGLLGRAILGVAGFDFDVAVHLGAGAYVCGEESALLESLEGRRGVPRVRPPFPAEHGFRGWPTVVNNVETFAAVAWIARHGGDAWAALGTPVTSGTKLHSVSGDCARPGVYEFPAGIALAELLDACGAPADAIAAQVGGPSGTLVPASAFGRRLAFEDLPTTGACMVFDATRDPVEVVRGFAHFFAHESCGFCTPCRVGTELVARRLDKLADGRGSLFDAATLRDLDGLLHGATHCGLGATAANPLRDGLAAFPDAFARRSAAAVFRPAFVPDAALAAARAATGRDDARAHLGDDAATTGGAPPGPTSTDGAP